MSLLTIDKQHYPALSEDENGIRHFDLPETERRTVQNQACCCLLSQFGILSLSGADAKTFLQGQITCDVQQLQNQPHLMGAYCDRKGRVLSNFDLIIHNESYCLIMPKSMLQITHDTLKKYALFSKVEFEIKANWHIIEILHATPTSLTGFDCIATQYQQQYIIVENSQLTDTWRQLTTQLAPIGIDAWQYFAIEQLRVYTQQQTSLCFLPQMLDLHGAISFNKGCYLGQEIVARTEHRGKVKKRLQKVLLENEHAIGESAPSHPGSIIVSTAKTDGGHIALIVARVDDNSSQP